jgi:hypothetical protein
VEAEALTVPSDLHRFSPAERAVRRVLWIPDQVERSSAGDVHGAFSRSMVISALRCVLTYIILPFVAPLVGVIQGVGPLVGLALGSVAVAFNVASIRRFFVAEHRWRWGYGAIGGAVICLLAVLMANDISRLLG